MGQREQILQVLVGKPQHLKNLFAGQPSAALQNLFACLLQQVDRCLCHGP